jgi:dTDP-4-dehydrorhamnose 3,5-epimerase
MKIVKELLPGCFLFKGERFEDERGDFFKLFHAPTFADHGLETGFVESYITTSNEGVVRGMHFQAPPSDHAKLVCCLSGRVRDGLVDLRRGSLTFKQSCSLILSAEQAEVLYVPRGVAHGFAAYEDNSRMCYMVSSVHDPAADSGVLWDSVGIDWWEGHAKLKAAPIVSWRDRQFAALSDFESPFMSGAAL